MTDKKPKPTFTEVGGSGLRRWSGYVNEEFLPQLEGKIGLAVYREMSDNDPTVRAALTAIDMLVRRVKWKLKPVSADEKDMKARDFVEGCIHDMHQSWDDFVSEAMSMLIYGYSVHEIVYKRREGRKARSELSSMFDDKKIGWKGFPIRAQETIDRWEFEDHGYLKGCHQIAPPDHIEVYIPYDKFLLFRTTSYKNNPEGKSVLRGAYRPWWYKRRFEEIEAIGVERNLAGTPVMRVDPRILSSEATEEERMMLRAYEQLITDVRRDAQDGIILPASYDKAGNQLFELDLMGSSGNFAQDTSQIIDRLDHQIARSLLADFILLGKASHGSYALSDDKVSLFHQTIQVWLEIIASAVNEKAVPLLLEMNGFDVDHYPTIEHGHVENRELAQVASFLQQLAASGAPVWPNDALMDAVMTEAGLPHTPADALATQSYTGSSRGGARRVKQQQAEAERRAAGAVPGQAKKPEMGEKGETGVQRERGKGKKSES